MVSGNWRIPRRSRGYGHWVLTGYRVADPKWSAGVNRIMGHRIGWFVVLGKWAYSFCKPQSLDVQRDEAARRMR